MKITAIMISICIILLPAGCTKEKNEPATPATGVWKGYSFGLNSILINKPNGTARLFFGPPGFDTASATDKFDGIYTAEGNIYSGQYFASTDTLYLELILKTPRHMSGVFFATNGYLGPSEFGKL